MRKIRVRRRHAKVALTHTTVIGITLTLIGGLRVALPDANDTALFWGGVLIAGCGFAGLWFTINGDDPPESKE